MSIRLAQNEAIVRRYDYATQGYRKKTGTYRTFKSLIVTNKRVIHEAISHRRGGGMVVRREMPVEDAKYVDTALATTSKPALLVLSIIFAVLGVVGLILPKLELLPDFETVFTSVGAGALMVAVLFLLAYLGTRKSLLLCNISTDHDLYLVMGISELTQQEEKMEKKKKKHSIRLEISIDKETAYALADELGAVILEAKTYEVVQEPAAVEAEDAQEELVEEASEEAAVEAEEAVEEAAEETVEEAATTDEVEE